MGLEKTCTCRHSLSTAVLSLPKSVENRLITAKMERGMTFTIEPIILLEKPKSYFAWEDGWTSKAALTVVLTNGIPSAQWEHTLEITEDGVEILTKREGETEDGLN